MNPLRLMVDPFSLLYGLCAHSLTGHTPPAAYQALIRLFCASGGRSNALLSGVISRMRPPYALPGAEGVLGTMSERELAGVIAALDSRGYYVFPRKMPAEICDRLLEFALDHPSNVRQDQAAAVVGGQRRVYRDDRQSPRGICYDFPERELLGNPEVQTLLCDPSILAVAQAYLRCRPVADVLALWWNTAYSDAPTAAAAQLYHFDMDRIKWLKFFVYLTDVGPENGPHSFIAGSHRTGGIPAELLNKGYARLTDDEVRRHYRDEDFIRFTGARGTVLVEDTRGLHKGGVVAGGDRLMLQLQFSNSLFGGAYAKSTFPAEAISSMQGALRAYPDVYRNYMP